MRNAALPVVLAGMLAICGVVGLLGGLTLWRQARRSRTWPTTSGVVKASRVAQVPRTRFTLPYQARVTFRYGVGERFYVSNLRSLEDTGYRSRTDAQRVADR